MAWRAGSDAAFGRGYPARVSATRIYLARLAGVTVLDPNGESVGKIRDTVIRIGHPSRPPKVAGLVVEMSHRRRIFIPMDRITSLDSDAVVLSTGTLSLRRFSKRSGETLVLGELLDRQVTVEASGTSGAVVDAGMEQSRTRDWQLTRLAVREGGPGFLHRRRGQLHQLEWREVIGLAAPAGEQGAGTYLEVLQDMRPADVANELQDLPPKRRYEVAAELHDDRLADVLAELPESEQVSILFSLDEDRQVDVLEAMDADDAADLARQLPEAVSERLLKAMEPSEAEDVRRLLLYTEGTAGSMMTTEPVIVAPDATVAECLARVRMPEISTTVSSQVFVCRPPVETPTGKYLGMVHIQRLLREQPSELVAGILDSDIEPIHPLTPLPAVTRQLATYNLVAVPVVDRDLLVGAVTVDDVLDHLLPPDWRDRSKNG